MPTSSPTAPHQRAVLTWLTEAASRSTTGDVSVRCQAIAAAVDLPIDAVPSAVQALITQGYLVQVRAHRSANGGRTPRPRIVRLA